MDDQTRELVAEAMKGVDELVDAQLSAPSIVLNETGGIDFDEWVKYVNVMTRLLTTQTARVTMLAVALASDGGQ
ncbi:hypothetical protein [Microbacterium testaceum]|uniref:hypothetical protein n=1 Tax=Microbacterium testaceum TaxID=2033 RepID=UPI001D17BB54|nr:hypothetical protein [Microbacterium testaceum]MCC4250786.1 hypothetical protein [Microbacterium testaceum]